MKSLDDQFLVYKITTEASLDPSCIINIHGQIVHLNTEMKAFLGIKGRGASKDKVFCSLVELSVCKSDCKVIDAIKTGTTLKLYETPAVRGGEKVRLMVKVVPIFENGKEKSSSSAIGAIVSLRDTTAEILLQAKYQKLSKLMDAKDDRIFSLEQTLKNSRR